MKKDFIFAPILLVVGVLLALLRTTGLPVHITVSVVGLFVLAVYTATTRKSWKLPVPEIIMRVCYGIALITGVLALKINGVVALGIAHRASAALFAVLLVVLFVHKLIVNKAAKK